MRSTEDLLSTFQFQHGTIKALLEFVFIYTPFSFNSNMVRLKPLSFRALRLPFKSFNSNMVRLKRTILKYYLLFCIRFNSNMVRLKLCCPSLQYRYCIRFNSNMVRLKLEKFGYVTLILKFQFQHGTIKA